MGKKVYLLLCGLSIFVIIASGCETAKGIAKGCVEIAQGVSKDINNTRHSLTEADDWMKKNLW